jgi:hypothetical protein
MSTMVPGPTDAGRQPQEVQAGLWLFAPSRDSQGGSAWWLELEAGGAGGGVLIDLNLLLCVSANDQIGPRHIPAISAKLLHLFRGQKLCTFTNTKSWKQYHICPVQCK